MRLHVWTIPDQGDQETTFQGMSSEYQCSKLKQHIRTLLYQPSKQEEERLLSGVRVCWRLHYNNQTKWMLCFQSGRSDLLFCLLFLIINYFSEWNLLLVALYQSQPGCLRRLLTFIICIRHHARYKQQNVLLSLETMLQWSNASMHHKIARGERTRAESFTDNIDIDYYLFPCL